MFQPKRFSFFKTILHTVVFLIAVLSLQGKGTAFAGSPAPVPLLTQNGTPVDWWFVFKFNTQSFPGCENGEQRSCRFGGTVQSYHDNDYSQQYVYASSENPTLQMGDGCVGDTLTDPIGATFDQVYNGSPYYVIWNDQFYNDPPIKGKSCTTTECGSPWGHSKGMVAWNDAGEGFVMQVSTPSWAASGSANHPRQTDGNTLGCVKDDDVEVSQHFFALRLTKSDLVAVLQALQNASVSTDPTNVQIVSNGGPTDVQALVSGLGKLSASTTPTIATLSTGVKLISKPSNLNVPPWQMVSALLKGIPLRTATWWASPEIPSTDSSTQIGCWDTSLGNAGAVEIATSGNWNGTDIGLTGGMGTNFNHAKLGVSTDPATPVSIFGDMNQQGALSPSGKQKCSSSQNGRGGTFYVVPNAALTQSITSLIKGGTAPTAQ